MKYLLLAYLIPLAIYVGVGALYGLIHNSLREDWREIVTGSILWPVRAYQYARELWRVR